MSLKTFITYIRILMHLQQTTFVNIVAKGEIAHEEHFFLSPQYFLLYLNNSRLQQICCRWERDTISTDSDVYGDTCTGSRESSMHADAIRTQVGGRLCSVNGLNSKSVFRQGVLHRPYHENGY